MLVWYTCERMVLTFNIIMVSKNLPVDIEIAILVKYSYLMSISR